MAKCKHSLRVLKEKSALALSSGQNSVYVRMWVRNGLGPKRIFVLGVSLQSMLSCDPKDFGKSAQCAALIKKFYGAKVFEDFVQEQKNKT